MALVGIRFTRPLLVKPIRSSGSVIAAPPTTAIFNRSRRLRLMVPPVPSRPAERRPPPRRACHGHDATTIVDPPWGNLGIRSMRFPRSAPHNDLFAGSVVRLRLAVPEMSHTEHGGHHAH
jgi:hypothetical protein